MKTITVTQEDIDAGDRGNAADCPVALATSRALGFKVCAFRKCIIISDADRNFRQWATPKEAFAFIDAFDSYAPVQPFTFELPD